MLTRHAPRRLGACTRWPSLPRLVQAMPPPGLCTRSHCECMWPTLPVLVTPAITIVTVGQKLLCVCAHLRSYHLCGTFY